MVEMEQREDQDQVPKRKRIATACKTCQRKKIRCDGKVPCTYCSEHKLDCMFNQSGQRRGSRRGPKYMDEIEKRLKKMESLLNGSSGITETDDSQTSSTSIGMQPSDDQNEARVLTTHPAPITSPEGSANHDPESLEEISMQDMAHPSSAPSMRSCITMDRDLGPDTDNLSSLCSRGVRSPATFADPLAIDRIGENHYVGFLAGLSIFSPKGIQWVIERTGNTRFKDAILAATQDESMVEYWRADSFSSLFTRQVFRQLPPKEEAIVIVEKFFRDFNSVCPLFSQPLFMALLERQYSAQPYDSVGWWASLNVVIAISLGLQALDNVPASVLESSRDYLRNGLAVLTELTIRSTDLFAVQALLGMALLMQGTPDPRPSAFLLASAMRLAHTMGLHKQESLCNLNSVEAEQWKRVFWIAYRLDNDMCIRSGLPLMQDSDDMNIELPSENPEDGLGQIPLPSGNGKANIFRAMAEFARIDARVHKQLYSRQSLKQSSEELLIRITDLDNLLEEWKENIPIDFQPDYDIKVESPTALSLHIIVLHFLYFHCSNNIHRTSIRHSSWLNRSSHGIQGAGIGTLNSRVFQSVSLSISAARSSIRLIRYIPIQDHGFVWRVLYFPVNAFVALFSNVLQTPSGPRTRSDLRLMTYFVEFLLKLQVDGNHELRRIFKICSEFEKIARDAVERAENHRSQFKDGKWLSQNMETDRRQHIVMTNGFGYPPQSISNGSLPENFPSTADDSGIGPSLISQALPGMVGGAQDIYGEIQPMFPNGLTMPWDGSAFHGTYTSQPYTTNSLDFLQ
ncbi:fungal-specific transcription factor domain-containing protein [Talaromyces proteolyticus]|uniref:Fungal-specific transcription factor domain-containing protein n=1 Tax=Talaromyces proteolyticus TaxID=1131652 RepID=A0AAD4Q0T4_9EURO|nr:fungal-specific transcription factor domain-containing protein [Talaromyces proteolyticus]KAH8701524.1 fungal-specific transcription factor domain-containing protein [Talaromyces proteolyticus]